MEFTCCHHRVFIFTEFWLFFTFSHALISSFFHDVITHCPQTHKHTLSLKHTNRHTYTPALMDPGTSSLSLWPNKPELVFWGQAAALIQIPAAGSQPCFGCCVLLAWYSRAAVCRPFGRMEVILDCVVYIPGLELSFGVPNILDLNIFLSTSIC